GGHHPGREAEPEDEPGSVRRAVQLLSAEATMKTNRALTLLGLLASLALPAAAAPAAAPVAPAGASFKVVVNAANSVSSMAKEDVAKLFLKKVTTFPGGQAASPIDQTKDSAVRKAFSTA